MDYTKDPSDGVTQVAFVELINAEGSSTVEAKLRYHSGDPYAVTIIFLVGLKEVSWTFGRDLLLDGLRGPAGHGDVRLRPLLDSHGHAVVMIELHSPGGAALVQAPARDLHRFVGRMTTLVGLGSEAKHLDLDAEVAAILGAHATE